jgi:hypothetical protein
LFTTRQGGERPDCAAGDLDLVPTHVSPRSALTSSQGT